MAKKSVTRAVRIMRRAKRRYLSSGDLPSKQEKIQRIMQTVMALPQPQRRYLMNLFIAFAADQIDKMGTRAKQTP